jgi:hypothetical protein
VGTCPTSRKTGERNKKINEGGKKRKEETERKERRRWGEGFVNFA